ncbi:helix-turn-helix domain-containing protein [Pedobacter africanus]|uniref:Helix-turn-helix n=1 Tax=Pedobacter africanus TaxID=151894 RepID=A0A1W2BQX9_9SPHI|nr:helix-turn-helix transcriptional regulator [Pedobacter africanus]SMC75367.1 Helix-turn-helix [Pedobacter africanus]
MRIVLTQIENTYDLELMEQQFYTELGIAIRSHRRSKNLSQDYMAKKLNISQTAYSKIEAGKSGFSAFRLRHIFKLLGIDPRIIIAPILEG